MDFRCEHGTGLNWKMPKRKKNQFSGSGKNRQQRERQKMLKREQRRRTSSSVQNTNQFPDTSASSQFINSPEISGESVSLSHESVSLSCEPDSQVTFVSLLVCYLSLNSM